MSFLRFGRVIYRHRKLVVGLWVLLALLSLPLAPRVASVLQVGGFADERSESAQALTTLQRDLGFKETTLSVIYSSDEWAVDDPRFAAGVQESLRTVAQSPAVAEVIPYTTNPRQVAADRHTAYVLLTLNTQTEGSQKLVPVIEAQIGTPPPQMTRIIAGRPVFYATSSGPRRRTCSAARSSPSRSP